MASADKLQSKRQLNAFIDHTLLRPDATHDEIAILCAEAVKHRFASVCLSPCWVPFAAEALRGSGVIVCTVAGFPLGSNTTSCKVFETCQLIALGAQEIDCVMNIGFLKSGDKKAVADDLAAIVAAAGQIPVKVIIEACLLSDEEKVAACLIAKDAGAAFVKTSTGFSKGGATLHDVALMKKTVGADMGVKASGGIRDYETALKMIEVGASRIGTSSGVSIVSA